MADNMISQRTDTPARTDGPGAQALSTVVGLHHVRVPVSNVLASGDWYRETLGLSPVLISEAEDALIGIVMWHPSGMTVGLHLACRQAEALRGFCVIGLAVKDLGPWPAHLDRLGVAHTGIVDGHLGRCLRLHDPDGVVIEIHTRAQPSADEA